MSAGGTDRGGSVVERDGQPSSTPPAGRTVAGLNLDADEHWGRTPAEQEAIAAGFLPEHDPFLVSREQAKERHHKFVMLLCQHGKLSHLGVPKENWAAARNYFDRTWASNCADFDQLVKAFAGGERGRAALVAANHRSRYLTLFGVPPGDDATAGAWFDWVCQRHPEEIAALQKEAADAVRPPSPPES